MRHKPLARTPETPLRPVSLVKVDRRLPANARRQALEHVLREQRSELESQNEDLRQAQVELAAVRDRLVDLYDGAPVGYLTLDHEGRVIEANLTSAALLGVERAELPTAPLSRFMPREESERWDRHLSLALRRDGPQRIELNLSPVAGAPFYAQLDCLRVVSGDAPASLRVALTDISQRRQAELARHFAVSTVQAGELERRRVSRELHEELGQHLSALKMDLASLRPASAPGQYERRIASSLTMLDEAIAWVRRIATDLRPPMLDDLGLYAAVDWLTRDTARRTGLRVTLRTDEHEPALAEPDCVALYRMVQDALADIIHRRNTSGVAIEIGQAGGELVLTIQDHVHLPAAAPGAEPPALGLLRQRTCVIGGQLAVAQLPGGDSRVTIRLPLAPHAAGNPLTD